MVHVEHRKCRRMIKNRQKMRSGDRIILLEPIGDAKAVTGMIDNRLFKGENTLHVVSDPEYSTWTFKYERGILPKPLKQTFTSFGKALKFAEDYFKKRNIRIAKV